MMIGNFVNFFIKYSLLTFSFSETYDCPPGHRKCREGQCIAESKWCDFWRDCPDNSDEENCGEFISHLSILIFIFIALDIIIFLMCIIWC